MFYVLVEVDGASNLRTDGLKAYAPGTYAEFCSDALCVTRFLLETYGKTNKKGEKKQQNVCYQSGSQLFTILAMGRQV